MSATATDLPTCPRCRRRMPAGDAARPQCRVCDREDALPELHPLRLVAGLGLTPPCDECLHGKPCRCG